MNLQEKVLQLKLQGAMQVRHALWWEKQIKTHGEVKAEAFYRHLGLNHIERKGYDYEGLILSREPKEHEKIAVKGIAQAQESAKESIGKVLLSLRETLISDGLKGIESLSPATYHTLVLETPPESRSDLRDRLIVVHRRGRLLVAQELERQTGKAWIAESSWQHPSDFDLIHRRGRFKQTDEEDEFDELDELADVTDGRVVNDVQSRIIAAAARFTLLGLVGASLLSAIQKELADGSVSYIDRSAAGLANKVISIGRGDEMRRRADDIERYEYSALLDVNTCEPCAADDGKEASTPDDLPDTPNPDCAGSDLCRCFIVAIAEGNM